MRSTERERWRAAQSGQSLVEALVASALVAIALVAGLQTLEAAASGARTATHLAWGRCVARGELEAVSAAAWSASSYPAPNGVAANVVWTTADQQLQKVVITVNDPETGLPLRSDSPYQLYKSRVLSGSNALSDADVTAVLASCQALIGR